MVSEDVRAALEAAMYEVWVGEVDRAGLAGADRDRALDAGKADAGSTAASLVDAEPGVAEAWIGFYPAWARSRVEMRARQVAARNEARQPARIIRREKQRDKAAKARERSVALVSSILGYIRGRGGALDMTTEGLAELQSAAGARRRTHRVASVVRRLVLSGYAKVVRGIRARPDRLVMLDLRPDPSRIA